VQKTWLRRGFFSHTHVMREISLSADMSISDSVSIYSLEV